MTPRRGRGPLTVVLLCLGPLAGGVVAVAAAGTAGPDRIAFVARGDGANFADALAVGPVAGMLGAPVFTTPQDTLDPVARSGLEDYGPDLVVVTGGPAAISEAVRAEIQSATGLPASKVLRVAGDTRYDTAVAVANLPATQGLPLAFLARGGEAADAARLGGRPASDYLQAEEITTLHGAAGWEMAFDDGTSMVREPHWTSATGDTLMVLPLDAPAAVGAHTFVLHTVELCHRTDSSVITDVSVWDNQPGTQGYTQVFEDETVRESQGTMTCQAIVVDTPIAYGATLSVDVCCTAVLLGAVRATWRLAPAG